MMRHERWVRLGIWGLTVAAYSVALTSPFQFDDAVAVVRDQSVHTLRAAVSGFGASLRPVLDVSYAVNWVLAEGQTWPFHVFNLLLHLLNVELVMGLTTAALNTAAMDPAAMNPAATSTGAMDSAATSPPLQRAWWPWPRLSPSAAVTGGLFAVHPIQTEAVTYVSGRSSSLSASFMFVSLCCYVAFTRSGRRRFYVTAIGAFLLAVATKELSVVLPLVFAMWEWCVERRSGRVIVRRLSAYLLVGAGVLVALVAHPRYFELLLRVVGQRTVGASFQAQTEGLAYLASKVLLLERPCIDPGLGFGASVGWVSWAALGVMGSSLVLIHLAVSRLGGVQETDRGSKAATLGRLTAFGLGVYLLQVFFPYILLPRADVINERHAYFGTWGLFLIVAAVGRALPARPRWSRHWATAGAGFSLVCLAVLTARRNLDYRSERSLWQATIECAPDNPRAFNNLGIAHENAGQLLLAQAAFAKAIALEPRYTAARTNFVRATKKAARERTPARDEALPAPNAPP